MSVRVLAAYSAIDAARVTRLASGAVLSYELPALAYGDRSLLHRKASRPVRLMALSLGNTAKRGSTPILRVVRTVVGNPWIDLPPRHG